jgi:hypothetical protein
MHSSTLFLAPDRLIAFLLQPMAPYWRLATLSMSFRAPPHCSFSGFTVDASAGTPCRSPHRFPFGAQDDGRLRPAADDFARRILLFVQKLRLILRIDICICFARLLLSFPSAITHIPSREATQLLLFIRFSFPQFAFDQLQVRK